MSQTKPEEKTPESEDTQADLFSDDLYEHETEDNLPEDITREFEIPKEHGLEVFNIPPETIINKITHKWEELREALRDGNTFSYSIPDGDKKSPLWEATISTELLTDIIHHLDALIDEFKIRFENEGIYISAVDPPNVGMIEIWIDESDFETYSVTNPNTIAIAIKNLKNVLKHTEQQKIQFAATPNRKLIVKDGFTTQIGLIDPDSVRSMPRIPTSSITYTAEATLPGTDLKEILNRASEQGTTLGIKTKQSDQIIFGLPGTDKNETLDVTVKNYKTYKDLVEYRERSISQYNFDISVNEDTTSYYAIDKLEELFKRRKTDLREDYDISLGDNQPIKINKQISKKSFISIMVAPKIKDDK